MKYLGIDHGEKRIGIAISDSTGKVAFPRGVLLHETLNKDVQAIIRLTDEEQIDAIVIGLALSLDGAETRSSRSARKLGDTIQSQRDIPIIYTSEDYSTNAAQEVVIHMDLPRKKRKGHHDKIAAVIILQRYLESLTGIDDAAEE